MFLKRFVGAVLNWLTRCSCPVRPRASNTIWLATVMCILGITVGDLIRSRAPSARLDVCVVSVRCALCDLCVHLVTTTVVRPYFPVCFLEAALFCVGKVNTRHWFEAERAYVTLVALVALLYRHDPGMCTFHHRSAKTMVRPWGYSIPPGRGKLPRCWRGVQRSSAEGGRYLLS